VPAVLRARMMVARRKVPPRNDLDKRV
jgi:hypothetical protein